MGLVFSWDRRKASGNRLKHHVTFEEAITAFGDPLSVTVADPDHSVSENRFLLVGLSEGGRLLVVAHTERRNYIRIISARPATHLERTAYEEAI